MIYTGILHSTRIGLSQKDHMAKKLGGLEVGGVFVAIGGVVLAGLMPSLTKPFQERMDRVFPARRAIAYSFDVSREGEQLSTVPELQGHSKQEFRILLKTTFAELHIRALIRSSGGGFTTICKKGDGCSTLRDPFTKLLPEGGNRLQLDEHPDDEKVLVFATRGTFPKEPPIAGSAIELAQWIESLHNPEEVMAFESDLNFRIVREWMSGDKIVKIVIPVSHMPE